MTDKMREEFEAWMTGLGYSESSLWRVDIEGSPRFGQYMGVTVSEMWSAWQASRAALVVELPTPAHWSLDRDMVIDAIEAAGVKVKP